MYIDEWLTEKGDFRHHVPVGCRDGALVRALASHQCGSDSIPRLGVLCGLSFLALYSSLSRYFGFLLFLKTNL